MNQIFRRIMSLFLALLTVVTLLPATALETNAYTNSYKFYEDVEITGDGITDMVACAEAQLGKKGADFHHDENDNWCANFLYNCAVKVKQTAIFKSYQTGAFSLLKNTKGTVIYDKNGLLGSKKGSLADAQPGDLVGYKWKDSTSKVSHVEIITKVNGSQITSIGGNTKSKNGAKAKVSQRDDDAEFIVLIVRPNYVCVHAYGNRGECTRDGCDHVFDFLATRKEISGTITAGTGKIWPMDVPYSASTGGENLLNDKGTKISLTGTVQVTAQVTNGYGNTWYEVLLEDGRIGYVYPDGTAAILNKILWISKEIPPKKTVFNTGESPATNVKGTTIQSASGYPLKTVTAKILKVESDGTETVKYDFSRKNLSGNSFSFPSSVDGNGDDALRFSRLKGKEGLYVYEIVATADPGDNADEATKAACTMTVRYPFSILNKKVPIILHLNDGTNAIKQLSVASGGSVTLPVETRQGFTFLGWASYPTASVAENEGNSSLTVKSKQHLYAVWEKNNPNTYTVQYDINGGTGGTMEYSFFQPGKSVKLTKNTFTRENYLFTGWNTKADGTGTAYKDEASVKNLAEKGESITLYAQWTNEYTVLYNGNPPSLRTVKGSMTPSTFQVGKEETLTANPFYLAYPLLGKNSGEVFLGWNTEKDGSGTFYADKATVKDLTKTPGTQVTLYAQWADPEELFTVNYNANGGTGTMESSIIQLDSDTALRKNTFTRNGYEFVGWTTKADGTGNSYTDGQSVKNLTEGGSSITLYANWKSTTKTYTVKYDLNGGSGSFNEQTKTHDKPLTLHSGIPTRDGYTFVEWINTKNNKTFSPGASFTANENVTLKAVWKKADPAADYMSKCTSYATYLLLKANTGTGYIKTLPCSRSTSEHSDDVRQLKEGETLTATKLYKNSEGNYWYQVTASDGKSGFVYGSQVTVLGIPGDALTLNVKLAKTTISKGDKCNIQGSVTGKTVEITWVQGVLKDSDGASYSKTITDGFGSIQNTAINKGLKFGVLEAGAGTLTITASAKTNYTPDGKKLDTYTASRSQVLKFTIQGEATYEVRYDANGGTGAPEAQTKVSGTNLTITETVPTRVGYTFAGWAESSDASLADYQPGDSYTVNQDITLYAVWVAEETEDAVYVVDNNAQKTWKITDPYTETAKVTEVSSCDTAKLDHVTLTLNPSEKIRNQYTDINDWMQEHPVYLLVGPTLTMTDLKADFYITRGYVNVGIQTFDSLYSYAFDLDGDADLVMDVHELKLHYNGGTVAGNETDVFYFSSNYPRAEQFAAYPVREGYTLLGWAAEPDATEAAYGFAFHLDFAADMELYAVWQQDETVINGYNIVYDSDLSAENMPEAQIKIPGEPLTLSTQIPTCDNFIFQGWSTNINGESMVFQPGDTFTPDSDAALWAMWEMEALHIYDVNSDTYWSVLGETAEEVEPFVLNELCHITITLNPSAGIREQYDSITDWRPAWGDGYYLTEGFVNVVMKDLKLDFYITPTEVPVWLNTPNLDVDQRFVFDQDQDLVFDIYHLIYQGNGGTLGSETTDVYTTDYCGNYRPQGISFLHLEKEGYTFLGWSRDPDATTAEFLPDWADSDFIGDITLYAVWE